MSPILKEDFVYPDNDLRPRFRIIFHTISGYVIPRFICVNLAAHELIEKNDEFLENFAERIRKNRA